MAGIMKTSMRIVVITGLGVGAAAVIAGPHRVAALAKSAQSRVVNLIDSQIDDPIVLRAQLRDLANKYPDRIAAVRADLGELREQMRQIQRDKEIGDRVVSLADKDIALLDDMLVRAQAARDTANPGEVVLISFNQRQLSLSDAYGQATRIKQTRTAYAARADDAARTLSYLEQQAERLQELLTKLETEHADFQAQLWQLDQQVDAVARNDRLLAMLEQRQKAIDDHSRFDVASLDQLQQRMAQIRAKQESQFTALERARTRVDYEDEAKRMLDAERVARAEFDRATEQSRQTPARNVIKIEPDQQPDETTKPTHVATRNGKTTVID